ncbi:MAG: fibrobacter succinogenes major paralogous domain-containing protein [Chitinispirillales bacterium]|jgi:uncharacterized protein (TIGR02145 family)|nr:fibrobacter succinogenes major paralogous domain-containing protein [Chitinispirillales bacterium]
MKRLALVLIATTFAGISAAGGAGTFTDKRDGKTYRTVKMPDGKIWMAENLNHKTGNSWCYNDDNSNCNTYGRLYDWNTARKGCPSGWHLPTVQEWDGLVGAAGGNTMAGKKLKSTSGWGNSASYNGTDAYGFSALPGGSRFTDSSFDNAGDGGSWWTATAYGSDIAGRLMNDFNGSVLEYYGGVGNGFSVRCVRD